MHRINWGDEFKDVKLVTYLMISSKDETIDLLKANCIESI